MNDIQRRIAKRLHDLNLEVRNLQDPVNATAAKWNLPVADGMGYAIEEIVAVLGQTEQEVQEISDEVYGEAVDIAPDAQDFPNEESYRVALNCWAQRKKRGWGEE